jgi:metal transporter CNNM
MYLFAPIAWPISKLLDAVLGADEGTTYKKAELKSFLQFHRQGEEPLREDEISILNGVLELNTKHVEEIMTPMADVVTLSSDAILDHQKVDQMYAGPVSTPSAPLLTCPPRSMMSGYSRFPVHEPGKPDAFIGLLLVKKLLKYDPASAWPVSRFPLGILPEALPEINCFQALDYFQTGRAHLLLITHTPGVAGGALGVITLEDIIEEIISEEIVDETDRYEDNQSKRRAKRATNAAVMRGIVERRMTAHRRPSGLREVDSAYGSRSASAAPTEEGRSYLEGRSLLARDFAGQSTTIVENQGQKGYGATDDQARS